MVTAGLHRDVVSKKRQTWPNKYWAGTQTDKQADKV